MRGLETVVEISTKGFRFATVPSVEPGLERSSSVASIVESPNQFAIENAKQILLDATSLVVPNRVAPSAQGGVGICLYRGNKYADIECLNTGEILATTSNGTPRKRTG